MNPMLTSMLSVLNQDRYLDVLFNEKLNDMMNK